MNTTQHSLMKHQQGLALLIAMIVLVVMSIAGIGLIRSVDSGVMLAGNLSFRQSAAQAGDFAVEEARSWLLANVADLAKDNPEMGYYSSSMDALDLTGNQTLVWLDAGHTKRLVYGSQVAWPKTVLDNGLIAIQPRCIRRTAEPAKSLYSSTGNEYCYVINRLCATPGAALDGGTCSTKSGTGGGGSLGAKTQMDTYQQGGIESVAAYGYYRITVRIAGPRNNVSFVQAYVII